MLRPNVRGQTVAETVDDAMWRMLNASWASKDGSLDVRGAVRCGMGDAAGLCDALAKIIVISGNKNIYPNELVPYWQILSRNAFGNYRQLLGEITISPQMGKFLDLANSTKAAHASSTLNASWVQSM